LWLKECPRDSWQQCVVQLLADPPCDAA